MLCDIHATMRFPLFGRTLEALLPELHSPLVTLIVCELHVACVNNIPFETVILRSSDMTHP